VEPSRDRIQRFLDRLVATGAATAAVAGWVEQGEPESLGAAFAADLAAGAGARFDLASLTKSFTATLALVLDTEGDVPLGLKLGELWPETVPALAPRSLEDLLRHRSSLAPWIPLYQLAEDREGARAEILSGRWLHGEGEDRAVYSDLGYILWGFAAEQVTGRSLAQLMEERVAGPWSLESIRSLPSHRPADLLLSPMNTAKEVELARGLGLQVPLQASPEELVRTTPHRAGLVQDGNARFLSGLPGGRALCGHAGLFGSLEDVLGLGRGWLSAALGEPSSPLTGEMAQRALSAPDPGQPTGWALGWGRQDDEGSSGPALSARAFGHSGFSGTSLWIDLEHRRAYALLATRTSPLEDFNRWRREFHGLVRKL
jgi:CubicO group peptidase (beta-lactamase class C family)